MKRQTREMETDKQRKRTLSEHILTVYRDAAIHQLDNRIMSYLLELDRQGGGERERGRETQGQGKRECFRPHDLI